MIGIYIFVIIALMCLFGLVHSEHSVIQTNHKHVHVLHYMYSGAPKTDIRNIQLFGTNDEILTIVSALVCMIEKNEKRNVLYWIDEVFG